MTRREKALRVLEVFSVAIQEAVNATPNASELGVPTGPMYAAFMSYNMSLDVFNMIVEHGVKTGKFIKRGFLLYPTVK